ncbi:MAG: hypothetical protein J5672_08830 [Verrucomicrobia bacterium]|nr:hypothetical protein [Verrucomicrobiota bacterium]
MKKFYIFIILSLIITGISAATVCHIRGSNERKLTQLKDQWNNEKQELQTQLDGITTQIEELKNQKNELNSPELDPAVLIGRLRSMIDMADPDKTGVELSEIVFMGNMPQTNEILLSQGHTQVREAFFIFLGLRNQGDRSLESIGEYLTSGENVTLYREQNILQTNGRKIRFRNDPSCVIPTTSRLGLIQTLGGIKTPAAMELLCQTMQSSTDLEEIMSAGKILLTADKSTYIKTVLAVCTAIFPNLKNQEQSVLLSFIKDISEEDYKNLLANLILYDENGKLSLDILRRKIETLGETALQESIDVFNRDGTSLRDKMGILETVKGFIGSNEQVNTMFTGFINGLDGDDKDLFGSAVIMLGARELNHTENNAEKQQQYLNLLSQLNTTENDQSLFGETLRIANDLFNQRIEQGDNFNEDEYMKQLHSSDYIQRMMNNIITYIQNHPESNLGTINSSPF